MPNWAGGVLTAKGRALQAKVEAGQTLELTKMKLGSGTPEPEEIDNLTDLKQPQNIMGISSKTVENNVCEVTSVILTSNINTPFYAREWGLFANDPDEGEILYMYTTDPNPDYIPDKNSALVISASYALNIAVLNVDNIIVNIDPEGIITAGILEEELKKYLPLSGGTLTGNLTVNGYMYATAPDISESNNKVPTAFWVKAYAPSKTGEGASGNWDIIANKAIADKNGLEIDTGYLKLTGGTMSGNIVQQGGTPLRIKNGGNNTTDGAGFVIQDSDIGIYDWSLSKYPILYTIGGEYATAQTPATSDNSTKIATTAFVNNYAPSKTGSGASGTWNITASKAIADKNGLQIDTGYLKLTGGTVNGYVQVQSPSLEDDSKNVPTTLWVRTLLNNKFTASKQQNGWWKDGNTGMIWQWGTWTISSSSGSATTNVTFPISFPNACLYCIPAVENSATDQIGYENLTNTGCVIKKGVQDNTVGRNGKYLVIGY